MSAPNFSCTPNSCYIYAFCDFSDFKSYIEENRDAFNIDSDEDEENALQDSTLYQHWYEDEKDYYLTWLKEEIDKLDQDPNYSTSTDILKVYDGDAVGNITRYVNFAGACFTITYKVIFKAGYYEGFTLDYELAQIEGDKSYMSFEEIPDAAGCRDLLYENCDINEGLCSALCAKLCKRIETTCNDIESALETILQTISPYHLSGSVLGNGEGIYTNCKKENI